jgi:hypothetical protein
MRAGYSERTRFRLDTRIKEFVIRQTSIQSSEDHKSSRVRANTSYQQLYGGILALGVHAGAYRMDYEELKSDRTQSPPLKLLA